MQLPINFICVENQIAVSPMKEAIPLMLHRDQLQVFNSPDLGTEETQFPRDGSPI